MEMPRAAAATRCGAAVKCGVVRWRRVAVQLLAVPSAAGRTCGSSMAPLPVRVGAWCIPTSRCWWSGVPAGGRVLRVPARTQADRRPDVRGRPRQDALVDLGHRGVRRLHPRPAHRHRRDQGRNGAASSTRSGPASSPASGWPRTTPAARRTRSSPRKAPSTRSRTSAPGSAA